MGLNDRVGVYHADIACQNLWDTWRSFSLSYDFLKTLSLLGWCFGTDDISTWQVYKQLYQIDIQKNHLWWAQQKTPIKSQAQQQKKKNPIGTFDVSYSKIFVRYPTCGFSESFNTSWTNSLWTFYDHGACVAWDIATLVTWAIFDSHEPYLSELGRKMDRSFVNVTRSKMELRSQTYLLFAAADGQLRVRALFTQRSSFLPEIEQIQV